jgi:hypothetical protein
MICGDCFLAKALCTDVFDDPDLKFATLLRAAEAGNSFAQIEVADTYAFLPDADSVRMTTALCYSLPRSYSSRGMIPKAVRWYKASGAQDCDFCFCCNILRECLSKNRGHDCRINMPKDLNGVKYELGWDYCAAQLERLGHIGDAYEIYRLHLRQEGEWVAGAFRLALLPETFHPLFFFRPESLGSLVFVFVSRASIKLFVQCSPGLFFEVLRSFLRRVPLLIGPFRI